MENRMSDLRKKALSLPMSPGVYIMKDKSGKIIYIGKSKLLKNRVSQYFGAGEKQQKVAKMVSNVYDFEYILTDTEFEALVLECSLIKQHTPKYNILLKDDKGYSYIKITKEKWPKIKSVLQVDDDNAEYIGPYTSSWMVKKSVDEALKIFKLPSCNRSFPRDIGKSRPCLNYYIKQCCAPCSGKITEKEYREYVDEAIEFLKGGGELSLKELNRKMNEFSENLEFEKAARIRDRISAIKGIKSRQKVVGTGEKEQDVIAVAQDENIMCFEVFRFTKGNLCDREEFFIDSVCDKERAREEFIQQYYSIRDRIPKVILVDGEVSSREVLESFLSKSAGKSVNIVIPKKGEKAALISMCKSNAFESLAQKKGRTGKETAALEEIGNLLAMKSNPKYIEAYDISNLANGEIVGGMVVFENGRPLKSAYRKFIMKSVVGQDDYSSMKEMLTRRFNEYKNSEDKTEGFARMPDLILLDGGKGHVSVAKVVLNQMNIDVPIFGMVKDSKHRTRAITSDGGEISIYSNKLAFNMISRIQDEVHRFAIGFHRKKRNQKMFSSTLNNINGVGEKRMAILLRHFKTIKRISEATIEELEMVNGINRSVAKSIYEYFHNRI